MRHIESNIQRAFVAWFRLQFPDYALNLTSVPNGGARRKVEAADLLLLVPRGGYGALGIEFKTTQKDSRQSPAQKRWQEAFERVGNKYVIVRTFDEAVEAVKNYLQL